VECGHGVLVLGSGFSGSRCDQGGSIVGRVVMPWCVGPFDGRPRCFPPTGRHPRPGCLFLKPPTLRRTAPKWPCLSACRACAHDPRFRQGDIARRVCKCAVDPADYEVFGDGELLLRTPNVLGVGSATLLW